MDILKPWLAANIEGELSEALRHREDGTNRHQSIGKSEGRSYDDGSNLRIPSTRKLSIVQITKFLTFEEPIQVTLSDSVIRVNASITNQASQRYAKKNRRKLTEGTVGGLIQLNEFEIVATHLGPRDKRLTLYVKDFKSLGSNGSGNFGVAPQAIESREGTKKLLNKLADLRRHGSDAHVQHSTTASPIKSQPSIQTSEAGNNEDSQVGFATQVPCSNAPIISKPKPPDPTTSINPGSTSTANSAKSLAPPTKGKNWNPLASTLSPLQLQAAPQRPGASDKEALLGLLRNYKRAPQGPEIILEPTTGQSPGFTTASIEPTVIRKENDASLDITLASGDDKTSRAVIGTQKRKRQSPINTPRKKIADENDLHGVDKVHESLAVSHDLDSKERSGAAVTEAFINTINGQPASSSISESTNLHSNASLESSVNSISKSTSSASGQNTGRNRISSREVKIPKDQETLLNRADSWLPAEPGQREPTTNIPISLLKNLNRKADLRAQRPTKIRTQRNGTITPSALIDQTVGSESDVPASSGQWPESPERDQLPPDSSLESAEHSDHSVHRTLNTPRLLLSSRRQSRVSISSHSMLSRRPSPTPTRDFPIESRSPNVVSWKVVDCGADNESNSVEVSASMPPLFDRELRTPRDAEAVGQRSSMNSVLKDNVPPDAQPTLAQSPTTNPDETYIAKESFLPLLPASPTPESDLEMTVPLALDEKTVSIASNAPMRHFPSTASQPQDSFTQVKRTPYVNGRAHNKSLSGSRTLFSPMKANFYPQTNGVINDETEFVSASVSSAPETSSAEVNCEIGIADAIDHQGIEKVATRLAEESNSQQVTDSILEKTDSVIAEVQQGRRKAVPVPVAVPDKPDDSSLVMTESQRQSSGLNQPFVATKANAKTQAIPETLSTPEDDHIDPLPQSPVSDHANHIAQEIKRKVSESSFVSPSVAKRQKRFKVPSAFTFAEKTEIPRDPSEGARQIRQDFLASRRSSESSTPTISPTMSLTFLTATKVENPRDPLERARQTRQEFLASRRSSETSTPTISPTLPYTTLLGTIQSEQRDAEVEKNVGKVAMQNQLLCTEIQRDKMTELEDLSARSQKQATKLDAAPLPNGTTFIEPDGEHAKPGAQFNSSFEYKADSLVSVAQNTNVGGPQAGQSTMIEASSHASDDEAQRSLSVELDVSFQSPDHQETKNDLAHASDDGDQTTNPGIDLMASRDQLANTDEDGRKMDSDLDNAHKNLPARADKVAKRRSTASTPEVISNQVAEPDTTALEPVHQQRSTEENAETRISDKTASEPTPQQNSLIVDVDTPLPDEIATEHTSQQPLIRVDTEIPTPDVQVDQNNMPLNLVAHMSEPMDQTKPPSFAVTAIVDESYAENQFRLSSAAVEPAIPLSNTIPDSEVNQIEEHQNAVQLPAEISKQKPPFVPQDIFHKFKATYPAYPGDLKHFTAICRKIGQLVKANRMEHQSLWDDFIVRHKIEYPQYLRRCAEEANDAVPYEDFYQNEVEGPQYQKRVINRRNLHETLALVAQKPSVEKVHVEPVKDDAPRSKPVENKSAPASDLVIEKIYYGHAPFNGDEPFQLVGTSSTFKPATSIETVRKPSESRVTIDLTEDDLPDEQPKSTMEREPPPQSSIPPLFHGVSVEPPPLQYRRDKSGNLYQVPYTPLAMRGSHAPPLSHSMGSPLVPATASTASSTKSIRRSLPWKESNHSVFQSSSNAAASDSPKRKPGSELREIRAKGSSNAILFSANSTFNGSKRSYGLLNTCHRVIQSNWGLKVHELLEPEYYRGQVLSETMIELLADIASKVNVGEARNRIKAAIDTRIGDNAWRSAGHPSRDRKMLKSDLEVVRGVVETSSMSTTSPFSLPHTNAVVEKQNEGTPLNWWDDENSPFKSFARAYTSIRHGNGNSFAKAESAEPGDAERVSGAASSGVQLKKIDIMRWKL